MIIRDSRLHATALLAVLCVWLLLWGLLDLRQDWSVGSLSASALRTTVLVLLLAILAALRPPWGMLRWWPMAALGVLVVTGILIAIATGRMGDQYAQQQSAVYVEYLLAIALCATACWNGVQLDRLLRVALASVVLADVLYIVVLCMHGTDGSGIVSARPFALFAVLGTAIAIACRHRWPRVAWPLAVLQIVLIGLSLSRTAYFVALGLLSLALLLEARRRRRWEPLLLLVVVWGVTAYGILEIPVIHDRFFFPTTNGGGGGGGGDGGGLPQLNTQGRDTYWQMTLDYAKSSPIFGHGIGASSRLIADFTTSHNVTFIEHPHNDYLRIFADGGVIALAVVAASCLSLWITVFRSRARERSDRSDHRPSAEHAFSEAALWGFLGMALMMVTGNALVIDFAMGPTAIMIGIGLRTFYFARRGDGLVDRPEVGGEKYAAT